MVGNAYRAVLVIVDPDDPTKFIDPDVPPTATLVNQTTRATTVITVTRLSAGRYAASGVPTSPAPWFIHFDGSSAYPISRDFPFEAIAGL